MSTTISATQPVNPSPDPPANHHRQRRRGGGRSQIARDGLLALRPASVAPLANSSTAEPQNHPTPPLRPSNGVRHGRRRGLGAALRDHAHTIPGRVFGGALTTGDTGYGETPARSSGLQGNAPEFRPGQSIKAPVGPRLAPKQHLQRKRRFSKSTAPDIATRVHEDIDHNQYECPICTSEVSRASKIWSCHSCWTVFHLGCIKQWAANAGSVQQDGNSGEDAAVPLRRWRCPGCNLPQEGRPSTYTCWCGKDAEPRSVTGLPPHSCGQTCGKSRTLPKKCPHPCELLCHAGPCPPCAHAGPEQSCFCGNDSTTRRCAETNYDTRWSCGRPCGDLMPCGEHYCTRQCHEGLCGACETQMNARCYCGKAERTILCCDRDDDKVSKRTYLGELGTPASETWIGLFQCGDICGMPFDCGKHRCEQLCHTHNGDLPLHCPCSIDVVFHCPCGKTKLEDITAKPRQSCEDSIPNCDKSCLKPLACGHPCQQRCHIGECLPCLENVTITCRCGRTTLSSICHQGTEEFPQCTRVCHATLNCGRHECGERCCPGEKRATERQSARRKLKSLNNLTYPGQLDANIEAEHICTRTCGRTLKCGNHSCQELCHKGPCGSCREAIFDEVSCHCGRTTLQPPLPCGTKEPVCRYDCERPKTCGHPQIAHNCHTSEEACPKCPYLTEKVCQCGRKTLKNQQCWFPDVRCGEICGKRLKCGSHTCRKTCHKPGQCEDSSSACQQACGKAKRACGHPCEETCHAPFPCVEDKACPFKTLITCDCQHRKQETKCNASKTGEGNMTKSLNCDDECARLARNRKLAIALDIDPDTHQDDHIPYSQDTISLYQDNVKWAQEQEREFRVFATDQTEKRLRFKPMPASQRAFLHNLAEDFGFDSESMDPEPHRHVAVFKTPRFVSAPTKTLRDCVRIRNTQRAEVAEVQLRAKSSNISEPYNGFLLCDARFALTLDELQMEVAAVQGPNPKLRFEIHFLRGDEVALRVADHTQTERTVDLALKELKLPLARALRSQGLGNLQLCRLDDALNVTRREADCASEGGWSQVAAKAAAPKLAPRLQGLGTKSSFTVLGNLNQKKKEEAERKARQDIVDDWEQEVANELANEPLAHVSSPSRTLESNAP